MGSELGDSVKKGISNNIPLDTIKAELIAKGFLENDVESAIESAASSMKSEKNSRIRELNRLFSCKEVFDKIGYGFANHQFVNILFYFSGASLLFIGLINGLRSIISTMASMFFREYSKVSNVSKRFISSTGIVFGFSFFAMAVAVLLKAPAIFAIALLLGILGVAAHGDTYNSFIRQSLKKERMSWFLKRAAIYGTIITSLSLIISGYVIDYFGINGAVFTMNLFGSVVKFRTYGFLLSFEITAFCFILSSLVISSVKNKEAEKAAKVPLKSFSREFYFKIKDSIGFVFKEREVLLLLISTIITSSLQILGNSYYGIFIYNSFKSMAFRGFMNVAVIFLIAMAVSFIGPYITKRIHMHVGLSPMIVFGTMLIAMMPLAIAFNPAFYIIVLGNAISIIGSSITGTAQGLLAQRILDKREIIMYFTSMGVLASLMFLIIIPLGALYTQFAGMTSFFKMMVFLILFVITPLNFLIVILVTRRPAPKLDSLVMYSNPRREHRGA